MPSSPEYRQFTGLAPEVIAAAKAAHEAYGRTTATDGTEDAALIAFCNAMKAAHVDPWHVLLSAAVLPGAAFAVRIEE